MSKASDISDPGAALPAVEAAQDYYALRSLGIKFISELGTQVWTDLNVSDPGITILEVLTYAITDLGYRTSFPIEDILAQTTTEELNANSFYTAAQILPNSPVTPDDFRKLLIDQSGVSNAWITTGDPFVPAQGLRKIIVQPSNPNLDHKAEKQLRQQLQQAFWANRNLGEVLDSIAFLKPQPIVLELQMIVKSEYSPEQVMASALVTIGAYLEGQVHFLTLSQMLAAQQGSVADVFDGPLLQHGFILDSDLAPQVSLVDPDQLIHCIRDLPGVESVVRLQILPQIVLRGRGKKGFFQELNPDGSLSIGPTYYPMLGTDLSKFEFMVMQGRKPYALNLGILQDDVVHLQNLQAATKVTGGVMDLPIPAGKFRDIRQYYSVQYDFPAVYDLGPNQPGTPMTAETAQMRGYLMLFDQVLANYLSQLAGVFKLFSWDTEIKATYFFQGLETALQDMVQLLVGMPSLNGNPPTQQQSATLAAGFAKFQLQLAGLRETREEFLHRRPKFLNHLLARLGRSLEEYVQQLPQGDPETRPKFYISTAERMLASYPALSNRRGAGEDPQLWNDPVYGKSGLQQVIEAIFGLPTTAPQPLGQPQKFVIATAEEIARQAIWGQMILGTEDLSPINMPLLMQLGVQEANYRLVSKPAPKENQKLIDQLASLSSPMNQADMLALQAAKLPPTSYLGIALYASELSDAAGSIYNFVNVYRDAASAQAAIAQTAKAFREYSVASERLYFIDHSLLIPSPSDPVHGLRILGSTGQPALTTTLWYPLHLIELAAQIDADNSTVQWGDPQAVPSAWPPDHSPPSHHVLPEAASPPEHDDALAFVFTILGWQDGEPYPVFPPDGIPLPATFEVGSPTVTAVYPSQQMRAYMLQCYDADLLANDQQLGTQLAADFQATPLPPDWVSAGKSLLLEQWGCYALYSILRQWQENYGPYASFLEAFHAAIDGGNFAGLWGDSPPASPPFLGQAERQLLISFAIQYYAANSSPIDWVVEALTLALAPSPDFVPSADPHARAYVSCVGRALGAVFLETYYPGLQKEELGSAISLGMGISVDANLEAELEALLVDLLLQDELPTSPPDSGVARLQTWLGIGSGFNVKTQASLLCQTALSMMEAWMNTLSPEQEKSDSGLGKLLGVYLAANPVKRERPLPASSLSEIVAYQVARWMGFPPLSPSNYQDFARLPSQVDLDWMQYTSPPSGLVVELVQTTLLSLSWYLRHILCRPDDPGAAGKVLLASLGLDQVLADQTLWPTGELALEYYCQEKFSPTNREALAVGADLLALLAVPNGQATSDPVLATVGAYALTDYLNTLVASSTVANATAGSLLDDQYYFGCYTSPPSGSPPVHASPPLVDRHLQADIAACKQQSMALISYLADTNWRKSLYGLYELVNQVGMAQYLQLTLPSDANNAGQIDQRLAIFQSPTSIAQLPATITTILAGVGTFYLQNYLRNRLTWQVLDTMTLGNAVLSMLPAQPAAVTPPITKSATASPVQYSIRLNYQHRKWPVVLSSVTMLDSQADADAQIQELITTIPTVKAGTVPFAQVFQPFYYPPLQGDPLHPRTKLTSDPYSNLLTVVGPDWPLRFQEGGFQDQVAQAVATEAPAHFLTQCIWISKQEMQVFEFYYNQWYDRALDDVGRDTMAQKILQFILARTIVPKQKFEVIDADGRSATP